MHGTAALKMMDRFERTILETPIDFWYCRSCRVEQNAGHLRPRRSNIQIVDNPFVAEVIERDSTIWTLMVARDGDIQLRCNGIVVARLTAHAGTEVLHMDEVPFERAEDVLLCITCDLATPMTAIATASLEAELAPWIAENL